MSGNERFRARQLYSALYDFSIVHECENCKRRGACRMMASVFNLMRWIENDLPTTTPPADAGGKEK